MRLRQMYTLLTFTLALALLSVVCVTIGWAAPSTQTDGQVYVVKAGDSLYRIAESFYGNGNLWREIMEATNEIAKSDNSFATISDPRRLRVGQKLWAPTLSTTRPAAPPQQPTTGEADEAGVRFVEPVDGDTVPPQVAVVMTATGLTVEPAGEIREGAGHMHILIDTDFVPPDEVVLTDEHHLHFGKGQLTTTLALEPGVHVLRLQFANGAHLALDGEQYRDTITVTVAGEADEAGVRFVEPVDGDTVPPQVAVVMTATGLTVEPAGEIREGAGHMHILIDTDFVPPDEVVLTDEHHLHFGKGQLTTTLALEPGVHVLRLQFANGAHLALDGEQYRDTITVTVAGEANEPGVRFVEPVDGDTVPPQVAVVMTATGLTVEPAGEIREGAGHMHILIDTDFVPPDEVVLTDEHHLHFGKGQLTTTLALEPGVHVLRLQFANGAHLALDGEQYRGTITVTVAE